MTKPNSFCLEQRTLGAVTYLKHNPSL